jgi:carbon-monoxide dehydrogenase catalytic subunit
MMHRTHMGVDQEYHNIMLQASRCSLADGWGSSMLSTELTDIMFGTPVPRRAIVDLGCLKKDQVNITVHGHEPLLAEALCLAAQEEDMLGLAKKAGAKGINLAGVCCTGNEILMRRGIPVAAGFVQQEMALATGSLFPKLPKISIQTLSPPTTGPRCLILPIFNLKKKPRLNQQRIS